MVDNQVTFFRSDKFSCSGLLLWSGTWYIIFKIQDWRSKF